MNEPFPILGAQDTRILPVSGFAWMILLQRNSDADAAITQFLGEKMKDMPPPPPPPPPPDFAAYPQFNCTGVGGFAIADCAWIALVRQGIPNQSGPNPTEEALMHFHAKFGRKIQRPKA